MHGLLLLQPPGQPPPPPAKTQFPFWSHVPPFPQDEPGGFSTPEQ